MACSCKKKKPVVQTTTNSTSNNDVKIQEQQNKRIVDAIMSKLSV